MIKKKSYDQELLEWRFRQMRLRKKYKNTPAGFYDEKEEMRCRKRWMEDVRTFLEEQQRRIQSCYSPVKEQFVGRKQELLNMQMLFSDYKEPVILYGIGGIGKTALAREYVRIHDKEYDGVLFLSFSSSFQSLITDDAGISISNLQYVPDKYGNRRKYFQLKLDIIRRIMDKKRYLMVVDDCNVKHDKDMKDVFSLPCHLLVTTRVNPCSWGYKGVQIKDFQTEEEWNSFIQCYRNGPLSEEEVKNIADYRKITQGHTLSVLLKIRNPKERLPALEQFEQELFRRFSLKKIEKQLLMYLSIMPVHGIPSVLFRKITQTDEEDWKWLHKFLLIQIKWDESRGDDMLSLHPIIAEAAKNIFCPTPVNCRTIIHGMENLLKGKYMDGKCTWERTYEVNKHLEPYVFALIKAFPEPVPWQASAFDELVTFLWIQGYYREAKAYSLKIFQAVEAYYGEEHQLTGQLAMRTAAVYHNSLDYAEAKVWYLKSLNILMNCRPFNWEYLHHKSQVLGKVSRVYYMEADYKRAMELMDKAIEIDLEFVKILMGREKKTDGEYLLAYPSFLYQKGRIFFKMNLLEEAESYCQQAIQAFLEVSADEFRMNEFESLYVDILMQKQEFAEAEKIVNKNIDRFVCYRGEKRKETLECREQMGDIWQLQGKVREARQEYQRILSCLQSEYPYQKQWIERICKKLNGE